MSDRKQKTEKVGVAGNQATKENRKRKRKGMCLEDRPELEPNAAGIDIGAREIYVAVPSDRDPNPVQIFATFTEDLKKMAAWLVRCGITSVAMESTGVYWIPLYDVLEAHGLRPRDAQREKRFEAKLRRQAQQRGYKLVPIEQQPAA
jgi:transposase